MSTNTTSESIGGSLLTREQRARIAAQKERDVLGLRADAKRLGLTGESGAAGDGQIGVHIADLGRGDDEPDASVYLTPREETT